MLIPLILLVLIAAAALFFFRLITQSKVSSINSLANYLQKVQSKYEFLAKRKSELKAELARKEQELATLKNNQEGIKTYSAADLNITEEDENEKLSRFLISSGKITMEQNEKVMNKMDILKMDYLSACMALGFIDLETSKKVKKANRSNPRLKTDH